MKRLIAAYIESKTGEQVLLNSYFDGIDKGVWMFPCGFAKKDESSEQALKRIGEEMKMKLHVGTLIEKYSNPNKGYSVELYQAGIEDEKPLSNARKKMLLVYKNAILDYKLAFATEQLVKSINGNTKNL